MIQSEREAGQPEHLMACWREHRYRGYRSMRIRRMAIGHEVRARKAKVPWDLVDPVEVFKSHDGICGICKEPVEFEMFTMDHRIPLCKGGPHLLTNLQPAHLACNIRKGRK